MGLIYKKTAIPGLEVLSCRDDRGFENHLHDGYVLWLVSASGERYRVRGSGDVLGTGSLSIIEPETIHANHPCNGRHRHLRSFYFSQAFLRDIWSRLSGAGGPVPGLPTTMLNHPGLWEKLVSLHESLLENTGPLELETRTMLAFADLFKALGPVRGLDRASDTSEERIDRIIQYFHARLGTRICLEEMARMADCTSYHLIRLFKKKKGISPHAFLVQLRLEHARKLLLAGMGIADAALLSGFSDQSHLTRKFKSRYGITPGTYLDQNQA